MRALVFLFCVGVLTMNEQTVADDKKDETYGEKLRVRVWDEQGKKFLNEQEVSARRVEGKDGIVYFFIPAKQITGNTKPTKDSQLTDEKGVIWVSQKNPTSGMSGESQVTARKKP